MENQASALRGCYAEVHNITQHASPYDYLKVLISQTHLPTAEHSIRVRICATEIGFACGLIGGELTKLSIAAEIHDVGKLYVPAYVLDKTSALTEQEWQMIRKHPEQGANIAMSEFPTIPDIARCVALHHERMDGSGYPNGCCGSSIPMLARIVSVADAFVALTEARPYRKAMTDNEAIRTLAEDEEQAYDQYIVNVLSRIVSG